MTKTIFLENCIGSVIYFFILTQVPFVYMERAGFMTCTAANHQGAIKEPAASLFMRCETHPVVIDHCITSVQVVRKPNRLLIFT